MWRQWGAAEQDGRKEGRRQEGRRQKEQGRRQQEACVVNVRLLCLFQIELPFLEVSMLVSILAYTVRCFLLDKRNFSHWYQAQHQASHFFQHPVQ